MNNNSNSFFFLLLPFPRYLVGSFHKEKLRLLVDCSGCKEEVQVLTFQGKFRHGRSLDAFSDSQRLPGTGLPGADEVNIATKLYTTVCALASPYAQKFSLSISLKRIYESLRNMGRGEYNLSILGIILWHFPHFRFFCSGSFKLVPF